MPVPGLFIDIGRGSRGQGEPDFPHPLIHAPEVGHVFQHSQDGRAVGVLHGLVGACGDNLVGGHGHTAGLTGEGVELLGVDISAADDHVHQRAAQPCHQLFVAVAFQRQDRPLIGQALALAAPVVLRPVAEQRIVHRHRGQRAGCHEFLRIQQMLPHKAVRHLLGEGAPVHAAQVVVDKGRHFMAEPVPVKARAPPLVPQMLFQRVRHPPGLLPPGVLLSVAKQAADLGKGVPAGVGKGHEVHGRHGHHAAAGRRGILRAVHRRVAVAQGVVLPGIVHAPAFQASVAVGVPHPPQVGVKGLQGVGQLPEIVLIQLRPVIHIQRVPGEAEALKLVELRLHAAVRHALDGAGQPSVRPLGAHEQQLVVHRGGHVALGVHFAAHRLGFQPDFFISAALHQHLVGAEPGQVQPRLFLGGIEQTLQGRVIRVKAYGCIGKHNGSPSILLCP